MPYTLNLPGSLQADGWKVKIYDKERVEPPHISIIRKRQTWRWGLRERGFLDKTPSVRLVPLALIEHIKSHFDSLVREWDRMYPENKVKSESK